ncbi:MULTISPECIES: hypothetical protein [Pectobacterium]|uniref:Uncharacterized protein n=1 Tax=Pectobacterium parvum TaxID=2778550 RepID=A0ABW8FTR7_9GAMM|nr:MULTISPECIES: hypothetical protein [Pectobacterium]KHS94794.1 hypothetical protein RC88_11585 [Pectobacterium parvum]UVD95642.1 hypothetical protein NV347_11070 [Pectobacterium parvum]GKW43614.1 hypothetical protein PEC301879_34720 [Pectobacterium carotovorum subsp. carotovorum]
MNNLSASVSHSQKSVVINTKSLPESNKKESCGLLSRLFKIKNRNYNIKFNTKPSEVVKVFSNNYDSKNGIITKTRYESHFGCSQEPALIISKDRDNNFLYYKGNTVDNKDINGEKISYLRLNKDDFAYQIKKDFNLPPFDIRKILTIEISDYKY